MQDAEFRDRYVREMQKACEAWAESTGLDQFGVDAEKEIAAGTNKCFAHPETSTMLRLFPSGHWCCEACAAYLWKIGKLGNGMAVFDMTKGPAHES